MAGLADEGTGGPGFAEVCAEDDVLDIFLAHFLKC